MKRLIALISGALVVVSMTITPVLPATADTVAVTGPDWTVTLQYPESVQWVDHVCQETPVYAYQSGTVGTLSSWEFDAEMRHQSTGRLSWYFASGVQPVYTMGQWFPVIYVCPVDDEPGVYTVSGLVAVTSTNSGSVSVPYSTSFTLTQMPTATSLEAPTTSAQTSFTGTVSALSSKYGTIEGDPSGIVRLEALTGTTWTRVGEANPRSDGTFVITIATALTPGSSVRATYAGSNTCAPSVSEAQVIPLPPAPITVPAPAPVPAVTLPSPTVKVKVVSGRSKLKVDVNPNMGRKYWTFQVQRKNTDGTWKALKTYRTLGSAEKRTINLPKGTYKVFVNPKFGYQGATSLEVALKR